MAGEVISLLSSPSVSLSQDQPLTYSDDNLLGLTNDSPLSAPPQNCNATESSQKASQPKRPSIRDGDAALGVFFTSDDFDTTGELDRSQDREGPVIELTGSNKRRRLSPVGEGKGRIVEQSQSVTESSNTWPQAARAAPSRTTLGAADPIEVSSSPRASLMPPSAQPRGRNDDFSDPFASSPPPLPATTGHPSRLYFPSHGSDDPFASTPPPRISTTKTRTQVPNSNVDGEALPVVHGGMVTEPRIDLSAEADDDPFASTPGNATFTEPQLGVTAQAKTKSACSSRAARWDPISSSAPEMQRTNDFFDQSPPRARPSNDREKDKAPVVIDLSDSGSSVNCFSAAEDSDESFPDLDSIPVRRPGARLARSPPSLTHSKSMPTSRPTSRQAAAPKSSTKKTSEQRAREKATNAAEREQEKKRKQREKEVAKEQKARDKERAAALAEVNKVRTDKKVSTPEMVVDLPSSLPTTLALQTQQLLKDLDVECTTWQSPADNVIKWRRKVKSRFNEDLGMWEPVPLRVDPEPYAFAVVTADDFVNLALGAEGADVASHVQDLKTHFPSQQLVYLIEGLEPWLRKNRNLRNRQFASAVRAQDAEAGAEVAATAVSHPSQANSRRRKNPPPRKEYIDEDSVEDALLELQVLHNVQIHHTAAPVETAQWIAVFTQHISTVPYRKQKEAANAAGAGFCMESGQVRTGDDVKDTYTKMLQEIVRVTAPIAYGVAAEFGSVTQLVKGLEEKGPLVLEGCRKSANKDGAVSERTIGQAVSRRLHKVFTGKDETSTDV